MKRTTPCAWLLGLAVGLGLGVAACAGEVIDPAGSQSRGLDLLIDAEPRGSIAPQIWMAIPDDCAGRLDASTTWQLRFAEGDPALRVVVDDQGRPVCVDTWPGIVAELDRVMGDPSPDPMLPPISERRP